MNGVEIGSGWVEEANTVAGQRSPLTVQSTMNMKKGDQVWITIDGISPGAFLHDYAIYRRTHFTGFILEEEIAATL